MDLVGMVVRLPLAPVRMVFAVARLIQEEADRQMYDPARVRSELEDIDAARDARELSDSQAEQRKRVVVGRLTRAQ